MVGRHFVLVWAIVLGGGCIEAQLIPCGDKLCPAGDQCVVDRCASPEAIAMCNGAPEGATCTIGGGVGRCDRGICVATGCGNNVVDPDEVCDDGNATSGDGCRGDCKKVEMCGDGIVDEREGCDDGNTNPADGCDACTPTHWRAAAVVAGQTDPLAIGLNYPAGLALDRAGNIFVSDSNNHRILRLDSAGVITTVAGTGTWGYSGDGGVATAAQMNYPLGIAVDGLGNLYIADWSNSVIRKVDTSGIITTIAGTGTGGYTGDGVAATASELNFPEAVTVDGLGNVYITDTRNNRIRKVDGAGFITTIAGPGTSATLGDGGPATSAYLASPSSVTFDAAGAMYIAEAGHGRVRRVVNGIISTVAGTSTSGYSGDGGPATSAQLAAPYSVAFDDQGGMSIADSGNDCIRYVNATGTISTIAGNGSYGFAGDGGPASAAQLSSPVVVVFDPSGQLYIADGNNHRIRRIDTANTITTVVGRGGEGLSADGVAATSVQPTDPEGVTTDAAGNFYFVDSLESRVRRVDAHGVIATVVGSGLYGYTGDGGPATAARLGYPLDVAVDKQGNIYVSDMDFYVIRRVDTNGIVSTFAGNGNSIVSGDGGPATAAGIGRASDLGVDGAGNVYFDSGCRLRRVSTTGIITTIAGDGTCATSGDGGPATAARINSAYGLVFDSADNLFFVTSGTIRRIDTAGIITTVAGDGTRVFKGDGGPATAAGFDGVDLAIDGGNNLYIADRDAERIRRIDTAGIISTIAGTGVGPSATGDGGLATAAALGPPAYVAADGLGNVYLDGQGVFVRRVDTAGIITTLVGKVDPDGTGPITAAHFADARALARTSTSTLVAGGSSGVLDELRATPSPGFVETVTGRYPMPAYGALARFRGPSFGTVGGVAYDVTGHRAFITETSANRIHVVTLVDPDKPITWTIATLANATGTAGFANGAAQTAQFRGPTGLSFDEAAGQLYVADTGNHVVRAIDLTAGLAAATVRTVAGVPANRGYFGDGGAAANALMFAPEAVTRCGNGDLFIADTANQRVRRIAAATSEITTVLGDGTAASSGEGLPASSFPVDSPRGLACDAIGNLYVTSSTSVRMLPADATGVVDGTGGVQTIYGAPPRDSFPASATSCLTGLAVVDAQTVQVLDACVGILVELHREP